MFCSNTKMNSRVNGHMLWSGRSARRKFLEMPRDCEVRVSFSTSRPYFHCPPLDCSSEVELQWLLWHFNFHGKCRNSDYCRLLLFLLAALHCCHWVSHLSHHWGEQAAGRAAGTPQHLRRLWIPGVLADTVQQYECSQLIFCLDQGTVGDLGGARSPVRPLFLHSFRAVSSIPLSKWL